MHFDTPQLFDMLPDPEPHARRSDPTTSDVVQRSLGRDGTMRRLIYEVAQIMVVKYQYERINDTLLWEWVEVHTGRRHQRNVVARARDIATDMGFFEKVGIFPWTDHHGVTRDLIHFVPVPLDRVIIPTT